MSLDQLTVLRELTDEELILVAGGSNWYSGTSGTTIEDPVPWTDPGNPGYGGSGGGTVQPGNGSGTNTPPTFRTKGRTGCPEDAAALQTALQDLANGSTTASSLLTAAYANNASINLIRWDNTTDRDQFDTGTNTISWDPFGAANGTNPDGSLWTESPEIALAHEIAHAANPGASEASIIAITNQIAAEMNASYGHGESTNRVTHNGSMFNVGNVASHTYSLTRPDCP